MFWVCETNKISFLPSTPTQVEPSVLTLNMMLQQACRLGTRQDVEDVLQVMKHTKTELSAESVAALARSTATHTRS